MLRVKVCCIVSIEEARLAVSLGAHALGLVSAMPSGPGCVDEATIAHVAAHVPPAVSTFLLTTHRDPHALIAQQKRTKCSVLQLVHPVTISDDDTAAWGVALRDSDLAGHIRIVPVIHINGPEALPHALRMAHVLRPDALLLDSGHPAAGVLGGTGRVHDWNLSRAIRDAVAPIPVFLAGGLRPENLQEAIETVRPYGVDVCNGVRTDGHLDPVKLQKFMHVAWKYGTLVAPS